MSAVATGAKHSRHSIACEALDLTTVLWTAWGRDWTSHATAASVAAKVRRDLRPGGTILLHDSDCTSAAGAWRSALGALPRLAEDIDHAGLRVVTLGEHLLGQLRAPVGRVGAYYSPVPFAKSLETEFVPTPARIEAALRATLT